MYNGIINVYKEKGYTSHDVVAKLRGILKQKKIGHTGTLDPDAKGVLPICLGKATKLCDLITDKSKTYEAFFYLGVSTDTQDMSGKVLKYVNVYENNNDNKDDINKKNDDIVILDKETIIKTINSFVGEYSQIPPMYSAIKVNGKKLYELARQGKSVERKARNIFINSIDIKSIKEKTISISMGDTDNLVENKKTLNVIEVSMIVDCSKGTYIRTLCHDIGSKLSCGAAMNTLLRTRVGIFKHSEALTLSQIEELVKEDKLEDNIVSIEKMFCEYKKAYVLEEFAKLLDNGNKLNLNNVTFFDKIKKGDKVRMYNSNKAFVAIYQLVDEKTLKPVKMFF